MADAIADDEALAEVRESLAHVQAALSRLGGDPPQFGERLSVAYRELSRRLLAGDAGKIRGEVSELRGLVEEACAASDEDTLEAVKVDEDVLRGIESAANVKR